MGRLAIYPTPKQQGVFEFYCTKTKEIYDICYKEKCAKGIFFNVSSFVLFETSHAGHYFDIPVWLVLRAGFMASFDAVNNLSQEHMGSCFGLGSDAVVESNKGLTIEGVEGYIEVHKEYLPVAMSDKLVVRDNSNWYLIWR